MLVKTVCKPYGPLCFRNAIQEIIPGAYNLKQRFTSFSDRSDMSWYPAPPWTAIIWNWAGAFRDIQWSWGVDGCSSDFGQAGSNSAKHTQRVSGACTRTRCWTRLRLELHSAQATHFFMAAHVGILPKGKAAYMVHNLISDSQRCRCS